jgi:hypothetical protein
VSSQTGIGRATLRDWRDHGVEPQRSLAVCWVCARVSPPPRPPEYAALLGFYLGDGCLSRMGSAHALRISCDRTYPGIIADVSRLVLAVHPSSSVCLVSAPGVQVVQNCWKHWPCLFPQHGPGRKHERVLVLADWQRVVVEEFPADFLRGLFHSDGCRSKNWARRMVAGEPKRYDYPRWQFVNNSEDIRRWCTEALDLVGVPWRASSWKTISVSTRAGVARLDELIGLKS